MRFCHVTTFYPPYHFGGDAILTRMICEALARRGHEVHVVYCKDAYLLKGEAVTSPRSNPFNIRRHEVKSPFGKLSPLITQQSGRPGLKHKQLRRVLDNDYDVVHFHNISLIGGPGILPLSRAQVTLLTTHDHWLFCATHVLWKNGNRPCDQPRCFQCSVLSGIPPQLWRYTGFTERCLEHVDAILAPSQFTADRHLQAGIKRPIHVHRSFTAPQTEYSGLTPTPDKPRFVCASRLVRSKGIEPMLQSFVQRPDYDLLVAGDGPLDEKLRSAYAKHRNIHFLGKLPHRKVEELFRQATAVISPSWGPEVFGLTVLESMANGVPAIVRRAGGSVESLEAHSGGLIYEKPEELLPLIDRIAADPELRSSLGKKGREEYLSHYSEDCWMEKYFEIIQTYAKAGRV